jgi:hypothetical protein
MKRMKATSGGQWWLVWVRCGARQWVLGPTKAGNVACLTIFNLVTSLLVISNGKKST